MGRETPVRRWRRRKTMARKAFMLFAALILFAMMSPVAYASHVLNLLEGEERPFDINQRFGATSLEEAVYDASIVELIADSENPGLYYLKAKQPTQDYIPIRLTMTDQYLETVTETVYVRVVENTPPVIYGGETYLGTVSMYPGDEDYLYIGLDFYDEDFFFKDSSDPCVNNPSHPCYLGSNYKYETLTYNFQHVPPFIQVEYVSSSLRFTADADAVPGVYKVQVVGVDVAGNEAAGDVNIRVKEIAPVSPAAAWDLFVGEEVFFDDFYNSLVYYFGTDQGIEKAIAHIKLEHSHGDAVMVCSYETEECELPNDRLEPGQHFYFTEPGVYDIAMTAVDLAGRETEPLLFRFNASNAYRLDEYAVPLYGSPLLSVSDYFVIFGFYPGRLYMVPYEGHDLPAVDQLELKAQEPGGLKKLATGGEGYFITVEPGELAAIRQVTDRVSVYAMRDGSDEIEYVKHFMLVEDANITVREILDYYEDPVYPAEDEVVLKLLLTNLKSTIGWWWEDGWWGGE